MALEFTTAIKLYIEKSTVGNTNTSAIPKENSLKTMDSANKSSSSGASNEIDDIYSIQAKITSQQSLVRQLKKDSAAAADVQVAVEKLLQLRDQLVSIEKLTLSNTPIFNRKGFDELILRKMYVVPSFEIHNGPAGKFSCFLLYNILFYSQHPLNLLRRFI